MRKRFGIRGAPMILAVSLVWTVSAGWAEEMEYYPEPGPVMESEPWQESAGEGAEIAVPEWPAEEETPASEWNPEAEAPAPEWSGKGESAASEWPAEEENPSPEWVPEIETPVPEWNPEAETPVPEWPGEWETPTPEWPSEVETPLPEWPQEPTEQPRPVFETDGDVLRAYLARGENRYLEIPEGIRIIGRDAFRGDWSLEVVVLPDSVEEIQDGAFADCVNLTEVRTYTGSRLTRIGSRAFWNCGWLDRTFAQNVAQVAEDAFDNLPEETPVPAPEETPAPVPKETQAPAPAETPAPAPETTEAPTAAPASEETQVPASEEDLTPGEETSVEEVQDPYEEIEWAEPAPVSSSGGTRKRQTHGKSRTQMTHDYDQVNVKLDPDSESQPMHVLTLDGEELELSLNGEDGGARQFTVSLMEGNDEFADGDDLILRAAESETEDDAAASTGLRWEINGAVLRKLNKSGIERLIFLQGDTAVAVPTEGFLAGWTYDELKSRGTAGRRFDYALDMDSQGGTSQWSVTVEGKTYELGEDSLAPMYLTGIETGTVEIIREEEKE